MYNLSEILCVFPPGSRGTFLVNFLTDNIIKAEFEFGNQGFKKFHTRQIIYNNEIYRLSQKIPLKIFIYLYKDLLDVYLYCYYYKNILPHYPKYNNLYSEKTFDKLFYMLKNEYEDCNKIKNDYFDYVIPFSKTFDIEYLAALYKDINKKDLKNISIIEESNALSFKTDKHLSIVCEIFKRILEIKMSWDSIFYYSLFDLYIDCLNNENSNKIEHLIIPQNFSDSHVEFSKFIKNHV